jgi:hypothetical protein
MASAQGASPLTRNTSRNTSGIPNPTPTYTELQGGKPKTADQYAKALHAGGYLPDWHEGEYIPTAETLSHTLLLLGAYAKGALLQESLKAVAALIRGNVQRQTAEEIIRIVKERLIDPCIGKVEEMENKIERTATKLTATYEEARDQMQRTADTINISKPGKHFFCLSKLEKLVKELKRTEKVT